MSTLTQRVDQLSPVKRALLAVEEMQSKLTTIERARTEPIAIIGIGCRFPGGVDSPATFWQLLSQGVDAISEVPPDRWDVDTFYHPDPAIAGKMNSRWGGFLKSVDTFDASFFGISPREATRMDPQQRLLLEVAWEAIEHAGLPRERLAGSKTGVYIGACTTDYSWAQFAEAGDIDPYTGTGTSLSMVAGRLSFLLDLHGPSMTLDTACASSLVAVHMACQSLRTNECAMAIAGGVNIILNPLTTICTSQMRMMAADGRCKTFDARADGFVRGEGCGVVVLKRLSDALADGDTIVALIRGSAVNQDGRTASLTAPNGRSQADVIREAMRNAGVDPAQVGYIEAHGTGTSLGDPIEVEALTEIYGAPQPDGTPCALGSVKTNIGHTEAAAGIAGLIKAALALHQQAIPPILHFRTLNPNISLDGTRLVVPTTLLPWPESDQPRFASVSSFGWSGTNAHAVLEEAPARPAPERATETAARAYLVPFSAQSPAALHNLARAYQSFLAAEPATLPPVADLAYTAAVRRSHHDQRLALVVHDYAELSEYLTAYLQGETGPGLAIGSRAVQCPHKVAFIFPGQGGQWAGMAQDLLVHEPLFRQIITQCDQALRPIVGWSLVEVLSASPDQGALDRIDVIQPAIFAIQVGLAALWRTWGIEPDAVVGHSMGEVAAAVVVGALSLEDGARIMARRSILLRRTSGQGAMAVIELPLETIRQALTGYEDRVAIAASNSPTATVISGDPGAIDELMTRWQQQGIFCRAIKVDVASHSPQMDPLRADLLAALDGLAPRRGNVPLYSTVTCEPIDGSECDAAYWARNLREPVLFAPVIARLLSEGYDLFLELSPHPTLTGAIQEGIRHHGQTGTVLSSLRKGRTGQAALLETLGQLYTQGYPLNWQQLDHTGGRCVPLPTYPWQRERYWVEPSRHNGYTSLLPVCSNQNRTSTLGHPFLHRHVHVAHASEQVIWEAEVDLQSLDYLDDHRVQGAAVLPGTGYVEIALAAAAEVFGPEPRFLSNITFKHLLFVPKEAARTVQVILLPETNSHGDVSFQVYSRSATATSSAWILHASGMIHRTVPDIAEAWAQLDPTTVQARCPETLDSNAFYQEFEARGNLWGPRFQGVTQFWRGDKEALSALCVPAELEPELDRYRIHPAVLDSCLHVLGATAPIDSRDGPDSFVPIYLDQVRVYSRLTGRQLWNHAILRSEIDQHGKVFEGDVRIYDELGKLVAEFLGLRLQGLDRSIQASEAVDPLETWCYDLQWERQPRATPVSHLLPGGTWLLFADRRGVGEALAARLSALDTPAILVVPGSHYACIDATHYQIRPAHQEDLRQLLSDVQALAYPPCSAVLHLWSLDNPAPETTDAAALLAVQSSSCASVTLLLQMLEELTEASPRLWLITQGAQPAGGAVTNLGLGQATVWGLGRTIPLEQPGLWGGLIDLDPQADPESNAGLLLAEIAAYDGEDQLAFRHDERYVVRLKRWRQPDVLVPTLRWQTQASYLISGGLGDLGLTVARWMVEQGARHLILLGRTPLPPRAEWDCLEPGARVARQVVAIRALEELGAQVHTAAIDVADEQQMRTLLETLDQTGVPPIRGVVHAAGVVDLQPLTELGPDALQALLRPKVAGAWLLHQLFCSTPLDFFVLFSSGAALLSSPLLGGYAAANTFMDALAHLRRSQGLPALSINWGFWAEIGLAARLQQQAGRAGPGQGMGSFTPAQGLQVLHQLMRTNPIQVGVLPVDWQQWCRAHSAFATSRLLADLVRAEVDDVVSAEAQRASGLTRVELLAAPPATRRELLEIYLRRQVAGALRLAENKLDMRQPLNTLGLDSLMAIELKNSLEADLGLTIPIITFLQGPSVMDLASDLLGKLGERQGDDAPVEVMSSTLPQLRPAPEQRHLPFPLNDIQQAYWIGQTSAFELGNVAAHIYVELDGAGLDLERLNQSWHRVLARHDMLRVVILPDGQQQILDQIQPYEIAVLDLRAQNADERERQLLAVREQMSHQVLSTDRWPLFDIRVSRLGDAHTRLHFSYAIMIADIWSLQMVFWEWSQLYENLNTVLPPLELSFRDYVLAERALQDTEIYKRSLEYWRQRLATIPPAPDLPLATTPERLERPRFVRHSARVEPETWQRLNTRASQVGLTPSALLLAAFADVLATWSTQPRFTINVTLFNRLPLHPQVKDIVGDFTSINMLAVDMTEPTSFEAHAQQLQRQLWADLEHSYVSGVQVLRELTRAQGNGARASMPVVFTSTLASSYTGGNAALPIGWLGEIAYSISQTPQVWLDHQVFEDAGALVFNWDVVEDLFPEGMIQDMFDAYCRHLEGLASDEACWQTVGRDLLTPAQRAQRIAVNTTAALTPDGLLHTLFASQAAKRPHQLAVISATRSMTYQEVYRRANQLGRQLRDEGARPNTLVAVVMEKGWEQVVAVLGILSAGAAYLPIDSHLPAERRAYLLENGQVEIVLTQPWLNEELEWPENIRRICVDGQLAPADAEPLAPIQGPEDLAYVIFTSGSTGQPKGVMIDHRGAVNTIADLNRRFQVGPQDRVLALSNLNFDLSVYDIFGTLAAGGTIVIPESTKRRDPAHWADLVAREQVTIWNSVPALMQLLVEYLADQPAVGSDPTSLRLVMLSGDWVPVGLPERIYSHFGGVELYSLGGATEASIWSILYPIRHVDPNWTSIPYGTPMVNQTFHVLDEALNPRPVWVPGPLYIGGIGLAKGYWRDEAKTNARFIRNPRTGERLYRTGDRGRYLPDGNIEFLGREDFQVKIQGHRIELGEIEAVLTQHPQIQTAVVTAVGEQHGAKRLVAYVVPEPAGESAIAGAEQMKPIADQSLWTTLEQICHQRSQETTAELESFPTLVERMGDLSIAYICQTLSDLGVYIQFDEQHTVDDLLCRCEIAPHNRKILIRWLRALVAEGLLAEKPDGSFASVSPLPRFPIEALWDEVRQSAAVENVATTTILDYVQRSAERLPALLRGQENPLSLLFPGGSWEVAQSIYQTNPLSRYFNTGMAQILGAIAATPERKLRILEIGAGTGGTTAALLPMLAPDRVSYTFTDISTFFTAQARQQFRNYPFLEYGLLDINRDVFEQGYEPQSFDVIVAANVLHDARNVGAALGQLQSLLVPQGLLLMLEGTKDTYWQLIGVGFIEGFSAFEDERLESHVPILTLAQWQAHLQETGFTCSLALPEAGADTAALGEHVIVAVAPSTIDLPATRQRPMRAIDETQVRDLLKQKLPEYMVPAIIMTLDALPLTANGKVDRQKLPAPQGMDPQGKRTYVAPRNAIEQTLAAIWQDVLQVDRVSIHDDFFEVGGDSLFMIRALGKVRDQLQTNVAINDLFQYPTISALAAHLSQSTPEQADEGSFKGQLEPLPRQQSGWRDFDSAYPSIELALPQPVHSSSQIDELDRHHEEFTLAAISEHQFGALMARARDVLLDDKLVAVDSGLVAACPLHIYLHIKPDRVEGVGPGVYYYHPIMHRLIQLSAWPELGLGVDNPVVDYRIFDEAAFSLFFVAPLETLDPVYHDQYIPQATRKAEALSEALAAAAFANRICFQPVPHVDFERIRHLFALQDEHVLVRSLLAGTVGSSMLPLADDTAVQKE